VHDVDLLGRFNAKGAGSAPRACGVRCGPALAFVCRGRSRRATCWD